MQRVILISLFIIILICVSSYSLISSVRRNINNTANSFVQNIGYNNDTKSKFSYHKPYGIGIGVHPGRVVWAHDSSSVKWDGTGYWWKPEHFNEKVVHKMVQNSIASLGGADKAAAGWQAIFKKHNSVKGMQNGYQTGQKIAIKVNLNGTSEYSEDSSGHTKTSYTNSVLLKELLTSLVDDAGIRPVDITVYDVSRIFPEYMIALCSEGKLKGVQFVGRNNCKADKHAPIVWSKPFKGSDVTSYLPTCVTEASYIINLANLKGHSWGMTLCAKNNFGSFINDNYVRPPVGADLLMNEPIILKENSAINHHPEVECYLHEAGMVLKASSGTVYYDGFGDKVDNLGVHEHWINGRDKKYSRNNGSENGIELFRVNMDNK